jgi:hypothetical protein
MGEKLGALETGIARLTEQTEAGRALAEAEEAGTRKGRSFEERVHEAIEAIAEARGDAAFHVGDEPGGAGTKKGDSVVEVRLAAPAEVARSGRDRMTGQSPHELFAAYLETIGVDDSRLGALFAELLDEAS